MGYNKKLEDLFSKWEKYSEQKGFSNFCRDGLIYRGQILQWENGYWGRETGDEDKIWKSASKKLMFLLKDANGENKCDFREWIFRQHPTEITYPMFVNMAYWAYGLLKTLEIGKTPDFKNISRSEYSSFFDNAPIAYVNCKKEAGGSSISDAVLLEHIGLNKDFLVEEINILSPDIIVCGGGRNILKNFLVSEIYKDAIEINSWIVYSPVKNVVIVNSYHPSYIGLTQESMYEKMMEAFNEFLNKYPQF